MKKLLFILLLIPSYVYSQNYNTVLDSIPIKDNDVIYSSVVEQPDQSKDQLYLAARTWAANLSKFIAASESEILMDDKESGLITIKQKMFIPDYDNKLYIGTYSNHNINIQIKENRYKYTIDGIFIEYAMKEFPDIKSGLPIKSFIDKTSKRLESNKELLFFLDKKIKSIIDSLEVEIVKGNKDDNW